MIFFKVIDDRLSFLGRHFQDGRKIFNNILEFLEIVQNMQCLIVELQRANPSTKDTGYFSPRGSITPHDAQSGFLLFPSF